MQRTHRAIVPLGLLGATAAATTVIGARSSSSAATTAVPNVNAANCHDPVACIRLINTGGGVAVSAEAQNNNGLVGICRSAQTGLPECELCGRGVIGVDRSRVASGLNPSAGVVGLGADGLGVLGISETRNGITGLTFNDGSKTGLAGLGVFGFDRGLDTSGSNAGVGRTKHVSRWSLEGISFNSAPVERRLSLSCRRNATSRTNVAASNDGAELASRAAGASRDGAAFKVAAGVGAASLLSRADISVRSRLSRAIYQCPQGFVLPALRA